MMNLIIDVKNGKKYSIFTKKGINILKKYVTNYKLGGSRLLGAGLSEILRGHSYKRKISICLDILRKELEPEAETEIDKLIKLEAIAHFEKIFYRELDYYPNFHLAIYELIHILRNSRDENKRIAVRLLLEIRENVYFFIKDIKLPDKMEMSQGTVKKIKDKFGVWGDEHVTNIPNERLEELFHMLIALFPSKVQKLNDILVYLIDKDNVRRKHIILELFEKGIFNEEDEKDEPIPLPPPPPPPLVRAGYIDGDREDLVIARNKEIEENIAKQYQHQ